MIKGMSRRVIMVESPDPELFENAIFIMKNDAFTKGAEPEDILRQAQQAANEYVRAHIEKKKRSIPPITFAIVGAFCGCFILGLLLLFL